MNQYQTATDGNVVQTAEVDTAPGRPFTLALGFGADAAAAIGVARASATRPFGQIMDGYLTSARAMVRYLFDRTQQADGSFPRNSLIDGAVAPDTFGLTEIDQDAYPLLMAWQGGFAGDVAFYRSHVRPAADFVVNHGPAFGVEYWEEHPGYSPSTIAAEIAGLVAASRLAVAADDPARESACPLNT